MTLIKILISITVISTVTPITSSKNGMVTIEVNIPSIFNQLLDINKSLNTLRASVGYNGKGSLENSLELLSNSDAEKMDNETRERSTVDGKNSSDFNLIKLQLNGLDDVATGVKAMRRSNFLNPDFSYQIKFPGLFDPPDVRRTQTQVKVEMAPGISKTPFVKYPPKYFEGKLRYLLKLKKKRDEAEAEEAKMMQQKDGDT